MTPRDADPHDIVVQRADDAPIGQLTAILEAGYGRPFSHDWFRWKHLEHPWGPSRIWVATAGAARLGIVFALPWRLRTGSQTIVASRLVDGATVPSSTRRGVFRRIVAAEIDAHLASSDGGIVLATATPPALAAHVKNGATPVEPIRSFVRPLVPSTAGIETGRHLLSAAVADSADQISTVWDPDALRWRLDPRSGLDYRIARLAHADRDHRIIYRVVTRMGVRQLIVASITGESRECAHALRAVARTERAVAAQMHSGPGTSSATPRGAIRRGASLLCFWDGGDAAKRLRDPADRNTWSLCGLDLEGAI
jgi:hypothetical protein